MIIIRDQKRKKLAHLENAYDIGYEFKKNKLAQAQFKLPFNDPKLEYCQPFHFAEVYDEDKAYIDTFRLMPQTITKDDSTREVAFECEHVLGTLIDDILFRYHEIGGVGVYTPEILQYILNKQTTTHWQLGQVDFARQFQYSWEHENLLSALFSVPRPFDVEYLWTWDTTSHPWTINLIEAPSQVEAYIFYGKNLKGIEKETDPKKLVTRVYPLGYGEGINQLSIEDVHPEGREYIDADTQDQFGIISQVWVDRRYEDAPRLYEAAKAWLEERKRPKVTYVVNAAELHHITMEDIDKFTVGKVVKVKDEEIGDFHARVVSKRVRDMKGQPGDVDIEIANFDKDIGDAITNLSTRSRVNETYAQGATNLDSYTFADNCDPDFPARMRFHISEDAVYVNKVLLNFQSLAFRAYSRAIEGGGEFVGTTKEGGAFVDTTKEGGAFVDSTKDGGAHSDTTPAGGGHSSSSEAETVIIESEPTKTRTSDLPHYTTAYSSMTLPADWMKLLSEPADVNPHNHGFPPGTGFEDIDGNTHYFDSSFSQHAHRRDVQHSHDVDIPGHTHDVDAQGHSHEIQDHTHSYSVPDHDHGVDIPDHVHGVDIPDHAHDLELPDHEHGINYGIYEGPIPQNVTVKVDGNEIPNVDPNEDNLNIIPYLAKDGAGKIQRGWHELEIIPDDLGRVEATLHMQVFIQSRGEERL